MLFLKFGNLLYSKLKIARVSNKLVVQANDGKFIVLGKINSSG